MPGCRQHWRPEAWHKGARSLGDAGPSAEANLVGVLEDYPAPLGQVPEAEQSHSSKLRLHPLFRFCLCFQRISDDLPQGALVSPVLSGCTPAAPAGLSPAFQVTLSPNRAVWTLSYFILAGEAPEKGWTWPGAAHPWPSHELGVSRQLGVAGAVPLPVPHCLLSSFSCSEAVL